MRKLLKVAILFGGQSGEHEVSILSARSIINNIDLSYYQPLPIYIDKQGVWHTNTKIVANLLSCHEEVILSQRYESDHLKTMQQRKLADFNEKHIDIVFPVLHGVYGEDGSVQGLLEILDLPYVGAGVLGSAMGMDKEIAKRLIIAAGIPTPEYVALNEAQWINKSAECVEIIEHQLSYPVFVKPSRLGSSVGVNKAKNKAQLNRAITEAFTYDNKVLIEQAIHCREIELAVLESMTPASAPLVSLPGEIITQHEFYSYDAKYIDPNGMQPTIPAELSRTQIAEAKDIAQKAFITLACQSMARVDLFWDEANQHFLFNEINTIPGFTSISMYPKMMACIGVGYKQLITHLLQLAMISHRKRKKKTQVQESVVSPLDS